MYWIRRFAILLASMLVIIVFTGVAPRLLDPTKKAPEKIALDRRWVNSSPYWLDRQICRWVGLCGLHHLRKDPASRGPDHDDEDEPDRGDLKRSIMRWESNDPPKEDPKRNKKDRRKILRQVPDYVKKHAPLVHLYSGEEFWPSDIRQHVQHMTVHIDDEPLNSTDEYDLDNLHKLNHVLGSVVLQSNDDVEERPNWLHSHYNEPVAFPKEPENDDPDVPRPPLQRRPHGPYPEDTSWQDVDKDHPLHRISDPRNRKNHDHLLSRGHKPDESGYSSAPAVLVVVDKGDGIVDAFWFFFYSYNLGQTVLGVRFGNHVGDWEHCMIRFENGVPRGVFFSEHEGGQAYAFDAVERRGDRPVIYSAVGSHAMYALPGNHAYILPFGLLKDVTDKGPLWDPALNNYAYHYDLTKGEQEDADPDVDEPEALTPAASNPHAPTSWFHFDGRWGDNVYSLADQRQWRLFGQYHYVAGPDGPKFKTLARSKMCQRKQCRVLWELDPKGTWY